MELMKAKSGWRAKDLIDFDGAKKLLIETYKHDGRLISRAAVNTYTATGYSHAFGLAGGGDYSERIVISRRHATEKAVAEQHAQAMQQLPLIAARAKAHYATTPRKAA